MNLDAIQSALNDAGLDGWLFFDFRGSDPIGARILGVMQDHATRRWFCYVPAKGEPTKLVHAIEPAALKDVPGVDRVYLKWQQLEEHLRTTLAGQRRIAMQYSPGGANPYVGRVDAGTVEMVRATGVEVVSSAELVQLFEARLTDTQWQSHLWAAEQLAELIPATFAYIADHVRQGRPITEYDVQQWMMAWMTARGMETDHPPIVGVDGHAADPHFAPQPVNARPIQQGSFVLVDVWAKRKVAKDAEPAIFADITWTGYVGSAVPDEIARVFDLVAAGRDAGVAAIRQAQAAGQPIRGCDVDDACRQVIADGGYGDAFIHRTGHSLHTVTHGNGAHLDNIETRDERRLIPRTCFTIEPGIYLPGRFGVRSEINLYLPNEHEVIITGAPPQTAVVLIQ